MRKHLLFFYARRGCDIVSVRARVAGTGREATRTFYNSKSGTLASELNILTVKPHWKAFISQ